MIRNKHKLGFSSNYCSTVLPVFFKYTILAFLAILAILAFLMHIGKNKYFRKSFNVFIYLCQEEEIIKKKKSYQEKHQGLIFVSIESTIILELFLTANCPSLLTFIY